MGETFDPSGMELAISFTNGYKAIINKGYTFTPSTPLTPQNKTIVITYTNFGKTFSETLNITVNPKPLSQFTWKEINEISKSGKAKEYFKIGDEKEVTIGTNKESHIMQIIGFDHDDLANGTGKAGITFCMKKCFSSRMKMFANVPSAKSFVNSDIYNWIVQYVIPYFDTDLQSALKEVKKKTSRGQESSVIQTDNMKVFLFSEIEIFNKDTNSFAGEGIQYEWFKDPLNIKKAPYDEYLDYTTYWTRSPNFRNGEDFVCADYEGKSITQYVANQLGVCFGFCI